MNKNVTKIEDKVMERLLDYPWPGNVRELQNVIERAVVLANSSTITLDCLMLPFKIAKRTSIQGEALKDAVKKFKMNYILDTIEKCGGNQRKASKVLGIQPSYLSRILHEYRDKTTS
jgi:Nif-specific regulatory protein